MIVVPAEPEDQVTRRQRFEAAHPDVEIEFRPPLWYARSGDIEISRIHLRWLLDVLESCDQPDPR